MNRPKYEDLVLRPNIVAETVCSEEYKGQEASMSCMRRNDRIKQLEDLRKQLTPEQIQQFAAKCDERCRLAYEKKAYWFEECVKLERGRDQLYVWIRHWMTAFLYDQKTFLEHV